MFECDMKPCSQCSRPIASCITKVPTDALCAPSMCASAEPSSDWMLDIACDHNARSTCIKVVWVIGLATTVCTVRCMVV